MRSAGWPAVLAVLASALVLAAATSSAAGSPVPAALTPGVKAAVAAASGNLGSKAIIERRKIGHSVQGRTIWAYRKGNPDAQRTVVIVGQMHGDERGGVRTARYLVTHVTVSSDADVWIIPTMNPDGLAAGTRGNARGVDLNRNWPTNWQPGSTAGSRALSEPETRAMFRFLRHWQPRFIASIHQPFGVVSRSDKNMSYVRRLSRQLDLPVARVQVGDCTGPHCPPSPTMTSWYNSRQSGYCVTIEYRAHPTRHFLTVKAGRGILRAQVAL